MEEEAVLALLDRIVREPKAASIFEDSIQGLKQKLQLSPRELFVWETIPLSQLPASLPSDIQSCWVFLIQAGLPPEKHRHPNSRQRTMSWNGSGDLQTAANGEWSSNVLVSNPKAPLDQRWVSIPANVWHRPIVNEQWAVVSFHGVPAEELIEEAGDAERTRKYL